MALAHYASEVVTPPLALVALLGCPGLHGRVGEYLRAAQKPPINSLGVAEPSAAPRLFGVPLTCFVCVFCLRRSSVISVLVQCPAFLA